MSFEKSQKAYVIGLIKYIVKLVSTYKCIVFSSFQNTLTAKVLNTILHGATVKGNRY